MRLSNSLTYLVTLYPVISISFKMFELLKSINLNLKYNYICKDDFRFIIILKLWLNHFAFPSFLKNNKIINIINTFFLNNN